MSKRFKWLLAFVLLVLLGCAGFVAYSLHIGQLNRELIVAVEQENLGRVQLLLDAGASPNASRNMVAGSTDWFTDLKIRFGLIHADQSVLVAAINNQNWPIAELIAERGGLPDSAHAVDILQSAAYLGQLRLVTLLLDHGMSVDASDKYGHTALVRAVSSKEVAVAEFLLDRGANINVLTGALLNVRYLSSRDTPIAYLGSGFMPDREPAMIRLLVERGLPVDSRLQNGRTFLIAAAMANEPELVTFLLAHQADVNAKDEDGYTALHHAQIRGSTAAANLLRHAGAKDK